nr:unnamed protein product [Callosobruchus analis]
MLCFLEPPTMHSSGETHVSVRNWRHAIQEVRGRLGYWEIQDIHKNHG